MDGSNNARPIKSELIWSETLALKVRRPEKIGNNGEASDRIFLLIGMDVKTNVRPLTTCSGDQSFGFFFINDSDAISADRRLSFASLRIGGTDEAFIHKQKSPF